MKAFVIHMLGKWMLGLALAAALAAHAQTIPGASTNTLQLAPQAEVDSQGIHLDQLLANATDLSLPRVRVADAPAFGQTVVLTRSQIQAALQKDAPELATNAWSGVDRIRIARRSRPLPESDLKSLLTEAIQRNYVRDQGELELRFTRPWSTIRVPDEPLEIKVVDMPVSGVSANFIARFELRTSRELLGNWQAVMQARVWREVCVAAAPLKRGQMLGANDVTRERRDILGLRDLLLQAPEDFGALEVVDAVPAGNPLTNRSLRARPIMHRGDMVEALVQDGYLTISLKVEVLEEGAPGQTIRVRNPLTRRELRGKVQNEQTILVSI